MEFLGVAHIARLPYNAKFVESGWHSWQLKRSLHSDRALGEHTPIPKIDQLHLQHPQLKKIRTGHNGSRDRDAPYMELARLKLSP